MSHHYEPSAGQPTHKAPPVESKFVNVGRSDAPSSGGKVTAPAGHQGPVSVKASKMSAPDYSTQVDVSEAGPKSNNLAGKTRVHKYRKHGD